MRRYRLATKDNSMAIWSLAFGFLFCSLLFADLIVTQSLTDVPVMSHTKQSAKQAS